jgi:hypothetical protein
MRSRRLLCIVGPLPLVLGCGAFGVCTDKPRFVGRARNRPGQFLVFVATFAAPAWAACWWQASVFQLNRNMPARGPGMEVRRDELFAMRWRSEVTGNRIGVLTR